MGMLYGSFCYADQADYAKAFFSSQTPFSWEESGEVYTRSVSWDGTGWVALVEHVAGTPPLGLVSTVTVTPPSAATCDPSEGFVDGMTLGWLFGAIFVSISVVMVMRRAAR